MTTVCPPSLAMAETVILQAWQNGQKIHLAGQNDGSEAVCLSLAGLNQISTLNVEDGVAIVEAGVPVHALREAAGTEGLWCPALRHVPAGEPIGAAVAGGHGWRSRGYGGIADFLLGSRFVCPSVGVVRHGGTAIKNATGYNLTALLAGSRGAFGIILSVNLRVVPVPRASECREYCVGHVEAAEVATALAGAAPPARSSRFDADSVLVRIRPDHPDAEILVEVSGASSEGVAARLDRLDGIAARHGARPSPGIDWSSSSAGPRLHRSVPPAQIPRQVAELLASLGPGLAELRFEATGGGIEAWVLASRGEARAQFSPSVASARLRETFRKAFDPHGLL